MSQLSSNIFIEQDETNKTNNIFTHQNDFYDEDSIGQFLIIQRNFEFRKNTKRVSQDQRDEKCQKQSIVTEQNCFDGNHEFLEERKKSIFHNFQKHLITLIKRLIKIKKNKIILEPLGSLAYDLWSIFSKTPLFNKKYLHMIFGVADEAGSSKSLIKMGEQLPCFQNLLNNYSLEQVTKAQEILRFEVTNQIGQLTKQVIQLNCNVNKFDEFYFYLLGFMEELKLGPISKRMPKHRKNGVVSKIKNYQKQ